MKTTLGGAMIVVGLLWAVGCAVNLGLSETPMESLGAITGIVLGHGLAMAGARLRRRRASEPTPEDRDFEEWMRERNAK